MDMGVGNRSRRWTYINCDNLEAGNVYNINKREINIVSIDEKEMRFMFMGTKYTLNREWQVQGTPEIGIPNKYFSENERFIFFFSCDSDSTHSWDDSEVTALIDEMMANRDEGKLWKNIPRVENPLFDESGCNVRLMNLKIKLLSLFLSLRKNDLCCVGLFFCCSAC